jgi:hypothetical protein
MPVPEPLKDFIDGAHSIIERAHNLNVSMAAGNAEATLRTVKAYVVPTPALDAAFDDAIGDIAAFHDEVVDQNTLARRDTSAIQNARQMALVAIARLAQALDGATASDEAEAIGLGW